MKFIELIKTYQKEKAGLFINGLGIGKIAKVYDDYIDFEIITKENKKTGKGKDRKECEVLMKEIVHIPINDMEISQGQKEIPKTEEQREIENDLEGI